MRTLLKEIGVEVKRYHCNLVGLLTSEVILMRELEMVVEGAVASDSCLRRSTIGLGGSSGISISGRMLLSLRL